jgi:hypothetical protein
MNDPKKKGPGRGGRRAGAGRKPSGRRQICLWIRADVLDALGPDRAKKIRDLVEGKFKPKDI